MSNRYQICHQQQDLRGINDKKLSQSPRSPQLGERLRLIFMKEPKYHRKNESGYWVISDIENVREGDCRRADYLNSNYYQQQTSLYEKQRREQEEKGANFRFDRLVPEPPSTGSYATLKTHLIENVKKPVIDQTEAVLSLLKEGLTYGLDFRAYEAIGIAEDLKQRKSGQVRHLPYGNNTEFIRSQSEYTRPSFNHANDIGDEDNFLFHRTNSVPNVPSVSSQRSVFNLNQDLTFQQKIAETVNREKRTTPLYPTLPGQPSAPPSLL